MMRRVSRFIIIIGVVLVLGGRGVLTLSGHLVGTALEALGCFVLAFGIIALMVTLKPPPEKRKHLPPVKPGEEPWNSIP
jgi:hypothetical protein